MDINQISVSRSHDGIIQNHDQPLSVPLAQQDIIDDMSLTPTHVSNQDTNIIDNSSDFNESQSIDINSINLNNHASNNRESPSGSDNIATRVRARNAIARQKKFTRNHSIVQLGIETTRLLLSHFHMNINFEGTSLL